MSEIRPLNTITEAEAAGGVAHQWSPNEQSFGEQRRELERRLGPAIRTLDRITILHSHPSDVKCDQHDRKRLGTVPADRSVIKIRWRVHDAHMFKQDTRNIERFRSPPIQGHDDDAGFDLYVSEPVYIEAHGFADVPHGFDIELPPHLWAWVVGRSSTLRNRGLLVNHAVIDAGYRGHMFTGVHNLRDTPLTLAAGERISQLIPMPLIAPTVDIRIVQELTPSARGANGFGSTGQ